MKKRIKSLLVALLSPLAIANAGIDTNKLGFSWEFGYNDGFASESQVDFSNSDVSFAGSLTAQDSGGAYGIVANAKSVGHTFGNFKSRNSNAYYDGTRKTRNDSFYAGLSLQRGVDKTQTEMFAGAKVGRFLLSSSKSIYDRRQNSAYMELEGGKTIGLTNDRDDGIESSGVYYSKGDLGAQLNFTKENFGSKISLTNLLGRTGETIFDINERLNAEIGYGEQTKGTLFLGYNVGMPTGSLESFDLNLGYTEASSKGAVIENRIKFRGKNSSNLRFRYETRSEKADIGFEFKY